MATRKGFILHFSNLSNLKMMLNMNDERAALDAIIKAIEFDNDGAIHEPEEFISSAGAMLYNSITGQIALDKKDYIEVQEKRKQSGRSGGRPKEFAKQDMAALWNELSINQGLTQSHYREVRKDSKGEPIYSFIDKKTEKEFLSKSKLFTQSGKRRKR